MIRAIVFDVDGTLSENVTALAKGWQFFAKSMKLKPPTKKEVKDFLGIPYYEIAPQMWHGFNPYEHAELFRKCIAKYTQNSGTVVNKKFLDALGKKYRLGIVTSARRANLKPYIGEIMDSFEVIITPEDTDKHKPDPAPLLLCCDRMELEPEEVLYVGDTMYDFLCAKGAGSPFVGVLTGVGTSVYFKKLGTPFIASVKGSGKYADKLNKMMKNGPERNR